MKLSELSSYISKEVAFPAGVTSYLTPQDWQSDDDFELKGGFVKDAQYAWLACGPNFQVIRTSSCAKIAAWTFGASLRNQRTEITCVTELPCSDGSSRVPHFVVGLALEPDKGMVCVFDVRGSKILRAIQIPERVTSLSVVDSGYGGCYPLPQLLSSMNGILAVGLAGGQVLLIDLCHINCDEGLSLESSEIGGICDELHPANLVYINKREKDPQTLEFKQSYAATSGDHLCTVLNDDFLSERFFKFPPRFRDGRTMHRSEVDVTAVLYVPQIASLVIGFNFGCFQIWNLTRLVFVYMSPMLQEEKQIAALGFQEPCDDPRNFCYLWAVYGNKECNRYSFPFAIMYAICYKTKEWIDAYGFLYQDFLSCSQRFDLDLVGEDGMVGGQLIACHTISKLTSSSNQKDGLQNEMDENIQEADMTLALFAWETWGTQSNSSLKMAVFDLNQWYKEQMPGRISQGMTSRQVASYMALFAVENAQGKPLLDVSINPESISQFTAVQSLEEHFYPWSLAFDSCSLFADRLTLMNHPGVQRDMLSHLEKVGPACFLQPTDLFLQCVSMGLKPVFVDVSCLAVWTAAEQREFLLSVALEYQLIGLLSRCATEWADGSQSALGCTLSVFLKWGWKRATILKSQAHTLCIPLYDFSGVALDTNSYKLLDYCGNQLHHLSSLFHGVLKMCKSPIITDLGDISQKAEALELLATYIEVVEWFMNVGLLPEIPYDDSVHLNECEDIGVEVEHLRVPYPAADLTKFYRGRREDLKRLHSFPAEKGDILFIDRLVKEECGEALSSLWEIDGGTGLYPPPSIQSLLRIYLLNGIPMHIKHSIIIYVFLDLSTHFDKAHRYAGTISQFVKFPSAFRLTPSVIKITQALWLLDHRHFLAAIDGLLDPLVSMDDLKPWQHQCIIKAFLYQEQQQLALSYIRVQQPPLRDVEDIRLNLTVLLVNGLVHEAFQFQRQHSNDVNSSDLLSHFFSICQQINQLGLVLQLPLTPIEEDAFISFLQSCQNSVADDMRVMYYLERSRIPEAMHVNDIIRNRRHKLESNPLKRSRIENGSNSVRDTIVRAYANTLPSVTKKLAEHCAQQKSTFSNWKQIARPTPMSVEVHRGEFQPVQYRSSLLQATLEKARETWNQMVQPPVHSNPVANQNENDILETVPFLCTPRAPSETFCFPRDLTPVIFPTLKKRTPKPEEDDFMENYPAKRFRYTDNFSSVESPEPPGIKNAEGEEDDDASALLHTPHVRRRTPSSLAKEQEMQNSAIIFTPQSILKVSKLVQSVSPKNAYEESVASGSGSTPELTDDIVSKTEIKMTPSLSARQIRFSFPTERRYSRSTSSEGSPDRTTKEYWAESRYKREDNSSARAAPEIRSRLSQHKREESKSSKASSTFAAEEEMEPGIGDMLEEEMNFTLTLAQHYKRQQASSKEVAEISEKRSAETQQSVEEQDEASDSSICLEDGEDTFHSVDSSYQAAESQERSTVKIEIKDEPAVKTIETPEPMEEGSEHEPSAHISDNEERPESQMKEVSSERELEESHILPSASDDEHMSNSEAEDQGSATDSDSDVCEITEDNDEGNTKELDDSVCIIEEEYYEESHVLQSSSDELHSSFFNVSNRLELSSSNHEHEVIEVNEEEDRESSSDGNECQQYAELKPVSISPKYVIEESEEVDIIIRTVHAVDESSSEDDREILVHDTQLQEGMYIEEKSTTSEESLRFNIEDDVEYHDGELNKELYEEETSVQEVALDSEDEYVGKHRDAKNLEMQENIAKVETPEVYEEDSPDSSVSLNLGSSDRCVITEVTDSSQESSQVCSKATVVEPESKEVEPTKEQMIVMDVESADSVNAELEVVENKGSSALSLSEEKIVESSSKEVDDAPAVSSSHHIITDASLAASAETCTENQVIIRSTKRASSLQPKGPKTYGSKQKGRARSVEPRLYSHSHIKTETQTDDQKNLSQGEGQQIATDNLQQSRRYSKRRSSSVQPRGTSEEDKVDLQRRKSSRRASSLAPESIGSSQITNISAQEMKVLFTRTAAVLLEADSQRDGKNRGTHDFGNGGEKVVVATVNEAVVEAMEAESYNSAPKRKRRSSSLQPEYVYSNETVSLGRKSRRSTSLQPESLGNSKTRDSHFLEKLDKDLKGTTDAQEGSSEMHMKTEERSEYISEPGTSHEVPFERQRQTRSRRSCSLQPESVKVRQADEMGSKPKEMRRRRSRSLQPEFPSEVQLVEKSVDISTRRRSRRFITSADSETSSLQPETLLVSQTDEGENKEKERSRRRSTSLQPQLRSESQETDKEQQVKVEDTIANLKEDVRIRRRSQRFLTPVDSENRSRRSTSLQPEMLLVSQTDEGESKGKGVKRRRSRSLQPQLTSQPQEMDRKLLQIKLEDEPAHSEENISTTLTARESLEESAVHEGKEETEVHTADVALSEDVSSDATTIKREDLEAHPVVRKKRCSSVDSSVSTVKLGEQSPGKERQIESLESDEMLTDAEALQKISKFTGTVATNDTRNSGKTRSLQGDSSKERTDIKRCRRSSSVPPDMNSDEISHDIAPLSKESSLREQEAAIRHSEIEEYTTARRLTRHQRSLLQRSLELAKGSHSLRERRMPQLPPVPEYSDQEDEDSESLSQASSTATRSSALLQSHKTLSPSSSQSSPKHEPQSEGTLRRSQRYKRLSSSRSVDILLRHRPEGSPHSMKSEDSAFNISRSSPLSTRSEEPSAGRLRRRSLRSKAHTATDIELRQFQTRSIHDSDSSDAEGSVASSVQSSRSSLRGKTSQGKSLFEGETRRSRRISQLQQESVASQPFQFSPPTVVVDKSKKEALPAAPEFVFSPPGKTREIVKGVRAHRMSLRGLHTITEEPSSSTPSTSPASSEGKSRKGSPKKSKKLKTAKTSDKNVEREKEKQSTESEHSSRRLVAKKPKSYSVFKQRNKFYLRKRKAKKESTP